MVPITRSETITWIMFSGHGLGSVLQQIIRIYKVQNIKKWLTSMPWEFSYLLSFMEKEKLNIPTSTRQRATYVGLGRLGSPMMN